MLLFMILGVILYGLSVGVFEPYFTKQLALRCRNCSTGQVYMISTGYGNTRTGEPGDMHNGLLLAILWPVMLPYYLANYRANPRLQLANERINAYWEDKRIADRANRIAKLEAEHVKALKELDM